MHMIYEFTSIYKTSFIHVSVSAVKMNTFASLQTVKVYLSF